MGAAFANAEIASSTESQEMPRHNYVVLYEEALTGAIWPLASSHVGLTEPCFASFAPTVVSVLPDLAASTSEADKDWTAQALATWILCTKVVKVVKVVKPYIPGLSHGTCSFWRFRQSPGSD